MHARVVQLTHACDKCLRLHNLGFAREKRPEAFHCGTARIKCSPKGEARRCCHKDSESAILLGRSTSNLHLASLKEAVTQLNHHNMTITMLWRPSGCLKWGSRLFHKGCMARFACLSFGRQQ